MGSFLLDGNSGGGGDEWHGRGASGRDGVGGGGGNGLHGREAGERDGVGGEAAVDVDLVSGHEPSEDDVGGEVAVLHGVGRLFEQPSLVVRNHLGLELHHGD